MFKYTKHSLKKVETILEEIGYTIRYERGNFQSGYCIVENRNMAVVNKFYDTEARINCLLEILSGIDVDKSLMTDKTASFYQKITKATSGTESESETESEEEKETEEETAEESEVTSPEKNS